MMFVLAAADDDVHAPGLQILDIHLCYLRGVGFFVLNDCVRAMALAAT